MSAEDRNDLLVRYLDGTLSPDELAGLDRRLRDDPWLRKEFAELLVQCVHLGELGKQTLARRASKGRVAMPARWLTGLAAAVLIAVVIFFSVSQRPAAAREIARVQEVHGEVYVLAGANKLLARPGQPLLSGQGLEVVGEESLAVVVFADATRLEVGAGTMFTEFAAAGASAKKVTLSKETYVFADVSQQPAGLPLVLATPEAEVVVESGKVSVANAAVEVEQGPVQFTRKSDGQSIQVQTGFSAVVVPGAEAVTPQPLPPRLTAPRATLKATSHLDAVAVSSAGLVAAGGQDRSVMIWDVPTSAVQFTLRDFAHSIQSLVLSPDGGTLAVVAGNREGDRELLIELVDVQTQKRRHLLSRAGNSNTSLAFSPDGQALATAGDVGVVKLWDSATGQVRATLTAGRADLIQYVAFTADGKSLLAWTWRGFLTQWDLATRQIEATVPFDGGRVKPLALSADGRTFAVQGPGSTMQLWDVPGRKLRTTLEGHRKKVESVAFSPDSRLAATGSMDNQVKLWDVMSGRELATLAAHRMRVAALAFAPDGKTLASAGWDNTVRLWDVPGGTP